MRTRKLSFFLFRMPFHIALKFAFANFIVGFAHFTTYSSSISIAFQFPQTQSMDTGTERAAMP